MGPAHGAWRDLEGGEAPCRPAAAWKKSGERQPRERKKNAKRAAATRCNPNAAGRCAVCMRVPFRGCIRAHSVSCWVWRPGRGARAVQPILCCKKIRSILTDNLFANEN